VREWKIARYGRNHLIERKKTVDLLYRHNDKGKWKTGDIRGKKLCAITLLLPQSAHSSIGQGKR
jgi:hypothetical protein